jgi:hypothetical protein
MVSLEGNRFLIQDLKFKVHKPKFINTKLKVSAVRANALNFHKIQYLYEVHIVPSSLHASAFHSNFK